MAPTTALHSPVDIDSEDSVFKRIFSDRQKPRKVTQADRMARIFAGIPTNETAINVSDFMPRY